MLKETALLTAFILAVTHSHAVVPAAPSNLTATVVSPTQINLAWQDNSNNESGFRVQRLTNGSYITTASPGQNTVTYSDTTVSPATTYSYHIRAYNQSGNSASSNDASAATPGPTSLKPKPTGIMLLMGGQLPPLGTHPALANANIDGMRVKTKWSVIEATELVYDWSSIDQAIALAQSLGKKISISIQCGLGDETPPWLYDDGAQGHIIQNGKFAGKVMVVIDDPVFITKWTRFIAALGARYDSNSTVNYIVMTGISNTVVEWYEPDASYFKSLSPPNPPGTAKWIHQAQTFIVAYANALPITPFFGALATPYGGADSDAAEQFVVDWAASNYPGRFGVMTNTLNVHSNTNFYPNHAINQYRFTQPTGFQLLWAQTENCCPDGERLCGCPGDLNALDESLTNGVNIGGRFAEVYEIDCNNSALQATITSHQAQFKALP